MVQFRKALIDTRIGAAPEAARTLEEIVKERPTKELDAGLTLTAAAESALANLAFASGDIDSAIDRFEDLKNGGTSALGRADRWQLVAAYVAKGQWDTAKQEINALLNNLKSPPTSDERVGAADIYRRHGDLADAEAQLDLVLKVNPNHPGAVITRASMLAEAKKLDAAAALLRKTIADSGEKPHAVLFLLLAAVETRTPPADTGNARALAVIDEGLAVQPHALDLVKARYHLVRTTGDDKGAAAFVAARAKEAGTDDFRRLLFEVSVEQKDYAAAERVLRALLKKSPGDTSLAANLVRLAHGPGRPRRLLCATMTPAPPGRGGEGRRKLLREVPRPVPGRPGVSSDRVRLWRRAAATRRGPLALTCRRWTRSPRARLRRPARPGATLFAASEPNPRGGGSVRRACWSGIPGSRVSGSGWDRPA